jgi:hypothetical protein
MKVKCCVPEECIMESFAGTVESCRHSDTLFAEDHVVHPACAWVFFYLVRFCI